MKKNIKNHKKDIYTIKDIIRWTISKFNASKIFYGHGTDNPLDEAIQLILPNLFLPLDFPKNLYNTNITFKEKLKIFKKVKERINNKIPISYLTNKAWFCGLEFYIDKRVIIPRSPISEIINNKFYNLLKFKPNYILDMCTGCGCFAIACAYSFPKSEIDAVDINVNALKITEYNIKKHKVNNRVFPIYSNLFKNIKFKKYDIIITNPPYINNININILPKEYKYEPISALKTKNKGLKIIKIIISLASNYLSKKGILICEVGNNMSKLINKYPKLKFKWFKFKNGGNGVFIIKKRHLINS